MAKLPKIRVERVGDGEYVVREYAGRNIAPAELFRGDFAEAHNYAEEYVEDFRAMAATSRYSARKRKRGQQCFVW